MAKTTKASLLASMKKQGLKLPHGYEIKKRVRVKKKRVLKSKK